MAILIFNPIRGKALFTLENKSQQKMHLIWHWKQSFRLIDFQEMLILFFLLLLQNNILILYACLWLYSVTNAEQNGRFDQITIEFLYDGTYLYLSLKVIFSACVTATNGRTAQQLIQFLSNKSVLCTWYSHYMMENWIHTFVSGGLQWYSEHSGLFNILCLHLEKHNTIPLRTRNPLVFLWTWHSKMQCEEILMLARSTEEAFCKVPPLSWEERSSANPENLLRSV